jgi:hypothetical protein
MNKNRIGGIRRRASGHMTAKSISIKDAGCKSGGCARKAVELTSGGLFVVVKTRLGFERSSPIDEQKSAEGIVVLLFFRRAKAQTALRKEVNWSGD